MAIRLVLPSCAAAIGVAIASAAGPSSAAPTPSPPVRDQASPSPSASPLPLVDALGQLDAMAQEIVVGTPRSSAAQSRSRTIARRWPAVRSDLVNAHAARMDLLAADSALQALSTQSASDADLRRAANGLTAAFAPLYAVAGDRVPPRLHRLDFITRSIGLDLGGNDWVRANNDLISARTTWSRTRGAVVSASGDQAAQGLDEHMAALQDAIAQRKPERARIALAALDRSLGVTEAGFDHQQPAWRRWVHNLLHV